MDANVVPSPLVSSQTLDLCEVVIFSVVIAVNILGVVTNAINMRVFLLQGVTSDSTTSALFALAMSNLLGSMTILPKAACFYVDKLATIGGYIPDSCYVWSDITSAYLHIVFSRVTCWIIVYVSVERVLCVLAPLRVKRLFRPRTSIFAMGAIYTFYFLFHIPFIANVRIDLLQDRARNGTVRATFQETALGKLFLQINNMLGNTCLTTVAMVIIAITPVAMLLRLQSSRKWVNSLTSSTADTNPSLSSKGAYKMSRKDREVVKTVSAVTSIYLLCLGGSHVPGMCILFLPDMNLTGANSPLFHVTYTFKFLLDGVNSAVNYFFYLRLSSKYRAAISQLFGMDKHTLGRGLLAHVENTGRILHTSTVSRNKYANSVSTPIKPKYGY